MLCAHKMAKQGCFDNSANVIAFNRPLLAGVTVFWRRRRFIEKPREAPVMNTALARCRQIADARSQQNHIRVRSVYAG